MSRARVVVDGSNIATEGRSRPSLEQLDEAVRAFLKEHPDDEVTVVVDATFGHRIDKSERQQYEDAVDAGEVISPPAGAVGRGDAFILTIAEKTEAVVLSNDSFQEFHGEHPWLFDKGRLVGGKPVPEVGWIFQERVPVRGPKSRKSVRDARDDEKKSKKSPSNKGQSRRGRGRGRKKADDGDEGGAEEPAAKKRGGRKSRAKGGAGRAREGRGAESKAPAGRGAADKSDGGKGGRRRSRGASNKPQEPVNAFEDFIEFAAAHPPGSLVSAEVAEYSSHGAYADAEGLRCYIPIKHMGDPIPRAARDVVTTGEVRDFVVNELDAPRRAIELAVPGFESVERMEPATAEEADLPIQDYDDMTARQITGALGSLDLEELEALATYEETHDDRKTVMRAIETRITRVRQEVEAAAEEALAKKKAAAKKKPAAKKKAAAKKKPAAKKKRAAKKKPAAKKKRPPKKSS